MNDKRFNLIDEPWIRVMSDNCEVSEVSLTDALLNAHKYKSLAGELPTQDAAILRLLLAVLHAVFENVDIAGDDAPIENEDDALDRWESLWNEKHFPEEPILKYLEKWKDSFWLFHPERPFWQVPTASCGTEYEASKLNGVLSESSNKRRLFPERTDSARGHLTYSEAARWILYVNAFDDTSAKPSKAGKKASDDGKLPSPGAGWLGKIGFISVNGTNLFETLMQNFVLLNGNRVWDSSIPIWEEPDIRSRERVEIPLPHDQAQLFTLQSRRLLLREKDGFVIGYYLLGGDFFDKKNAFTEQMTVWQAVWDKKRENIEYYQPKRHDKSKQMWRDFESYGFLPDGNNNGKVKIPGVVEWNIYLQNEGILSTKKMISLQIASVQYGDKDFFAADTYSDSVSLYLNLLSNLGRRYRSIITEEIHRCEKISLYISVLAKELYIAGGGDTENVKSYDNSIMSTAKEQFYFRIDMPFRNWLSSLNANDNEDKMTESVLSWRKTSESIANILADEMISAAGKNAFIGKTIEDKNTKKKQYYSSPTAESHYKRSMFGLNN